MNDGQREFELVRQRIPWGTQTNGKRPDESLSDVTPWFVRRANGCRFEASDGRSFLDFRSALGPVILGYGFPAVHEAVERQLKDGVLFSLASPLEMKVAEQLCQMVPTLEQVRFLKSGNEANLAALRLARAFTARDHVAVCGYHGHGDWFATGQEGNGVPALLASLVTRVKYGDTEALEECFHRQGPSIAALMVVPYDWGDQVASEFLQTARRLTTEAGSVLIFDEMLTGFRLAPGGASEYFGVRPDLATFGKAIANGFPLSAFGGRREIMEMLNRVMITTTHAGEAVSLAAAQATLQTIANEPVVEHIWKMGERLLNGINGRATLPVTASGLPAAPLVSTGEDERFYTEFCRQLLSRGVFPARNFLLSYAHRPADIDAAIQAVCDASEAASREDA